MPFKSSAWTGCKIRSNISLPELRWGSVHFSVMPPSEFHSSGQFRSCTFLRKEHEVWVSTRFSQITHCHQISWGRPENCRTGLLAIFCWEALKGMRQQLCLNAWILAYMGLCVCVRTALLLFCLFVICTILNAMERGLARKKQTSPPSPLNVYNNPTSTCKAKASQWASAGSDYEYGGEYELPECHTPSTVLVCLSVSACVPIFCMSNTETIVSSAPPNSFPARWLHCCLWTWILQVANLPVLASNPPLLTHWSQPLSSSAGARLLPGTKEHSQVIPSLENLPSQLSDPSSNSASKIPVGPAEALNSCCFLS